MQRSQYQSLNLVFRGNNPFLIDHQRGDDSLFRQVQENQAQALRGGKPVGAQTNTNFMHRKRGETGIGKAALRIDGQGCNLPVNNDGGFWGIF